MVGTKNAISSGCDPVAIGAKRGASKANGKSEEKDDFKAMLNNNVQDSKKKCTEKEKKPENKPENKEGSSIEENAELPKKDKSEEMQNGLEIQAVLQNFLSLREAADLAPAELPQDGTEGVALEAVSGENDALGTEGLQLQAKEENALHTLAKASVEPETARIDTKTQGAAVVEQNADRRPVMEAEQGNTAELKAEFKAEFKAVLQEDAKGTEGEFVNLKQEQKGLHEQNGAEVQTPQSTIVQQGNAEEPLVQIKVGDTVDISAPKMAEKMADTVLVKMQEGMNEYEIQLQPQELGKIKIKLVIEAGKIDVVMSCENQKAAELMAANGGKLKAIIEERTGNETNVQVRQEDETAYHQQEGREQGSRGGEQRQNKKHQGDASDFVQQLRLGLLDLV